MKTFAGVTIPAAVISAGNIFGREVAASRTAWYPEMVAMDERASMLWAGDPGIGSIARDETPVAARSEHSFNALRGSPKPIKV
jgi:hypothetical protein